MSSLSLEQNGAGRSGPDRSPRRQGSDLMVALAAVLLSALSGCGNPSYDVQIEQLPPDTGAKEGGSHRPGQPCLLCHGPYKGASPQLAVAGTVFSDKTQADSYVDAAADAAKLGQPGVTVTVYDTAVATGRQKKSDASGNFWLTVDEYTPLFPLGARMDCLKADGTTLQFTMASRISREGSCNACHSVKRDQSSAGWLECAP